MVTTFIKQVYENLISVAQRTDDGKLPVRVNFILDEFCNLPAIPDMPAMISAARSRNMRYYLIVQGMHQLTAKYHDDAETIKGNCENWVFLTTKELALLNEISDLCGDFITGSGQKRKLISVSELQRLNKEKGEVLLLYGRKYPFITELPDISEYEMYESHLSEPLALNDNVKYKMFSVADTYNLVKAGTLSLFDDETDECEEDDEIDTCEEFEETNQDEFWHQGDLESDDSSESSQSMFSYFEDIIAEKLDKLYGKCNEEEEEE